MTKHGVRNEKRAKVDSHVLEVMVCLVVGLSERWIAQRFELDLNYVREAVARWGLPYGGGTGLGRRPMSEVIKELEGVVVEVGGKRIPLSWDVGQAILDRRYNLAEQTELERLRRVAKNQQAKFNRVRRLGQPGLTGRPARDQRDTGQDGERER